LCPDHQLLYEVHKNASETVLLFIQLLSFLPEAQPNGYPTCLPGTDQSLCVCLLAVNIQCVVAGACCKNIGTEVQFYGFEK
jgi:hypothetical protein